MNGRTCLVTGANSGIGLATAAALAQAGGTVFLACRDPDRGEAARRQVGAPEGSVLALDLASFASVRAAADALSRRIPHLDVLVNSAGHTFLRAEQTADGLEAGFAVNVLGPFLLTALLEPLLSRAPTARIVDLAGVYYRKGVLDLDDLFFERRGFDAWAVANTTQQARVWLMAERARRLPPTITVNAVHPGAVLTNAQNELPWGVRLLIHTVLRPGFVGPTRGARPVVRLASAADVAGVTGRFFHRFREEEPGTDPALTSALWERCTQLCAGVLGNR